MALERYDPPGFLADFTTRHQLDAWSDAVAGWIDEAIAIETRRLSNGELCQFYDQRKITPSGRTIEQPIVWNALSGTLRNRYGRERALELADRLLPLTERMDGPGSYLVGDQWKHLYYRPQDEYCEWHVTRDADGSIRRVTFTSEPPEYWQALHGDSLPNLENHPTYPTTGDRKMLVELYREYISRDVQPEDLICAEDLVDYSNPEEPTVVYRKGEYNPYNMWNTTNGAMHLTHPANSLGAEIALAADATILRHKDGRPVTDPDALIGYAAYGGPNRTSDPTIGASVNSLAWLGAYLTLRNPIGLAMNHIDLAGITTPHGEPVTSQYFRTLRGRESAGQIERAVFEVPKGERFSVSDLKIGGRPIRHGGQLAERIAVNLVAIAAQLGTFHNTALDGTGSTGEDRKTPTFLRFAQGGHLPPGYGPAFDYPPPESGTAANVAVLAEAAVAQTGNARRHPLRHRAG
jgi:hypothetical protein